VASTNIAPVGLGLTGMTVNTLMEELELKQEQKLKEAGPDTPTLMTNDDQQGPKTLTWEQYQAMPKHERDRLVVTQGFAVAPDFVPEGVKKLVVNRNGRAYLLIGDQVDEYLAGKKAYFDGKSREAKKKKNKRKASKLARKCNR